MRPPGHKLRLHFRRCSTSASSSCGGCLQGPEKSQPIRKQTDCHGWHAHHSPRSASLDGGVRQHPRLGRPDMDQRRAPTRRSRAPKVADVPRCARSQKEARGSCRGRQKNQRFANIEGRCSLWISRYTRRSPGCSVHQRFVHASRYPHAPCELPERPRIRRTEVAASVEDRPV